MMGSLRDHVDVVLRFRDKYNLTTLIETGTFRGNSTSWAAEHFDRVYTIDLREDFQDQARKNCEAYSNIEYYLGDSRVILPALVETLTGPTLFWLDAHGITNFHVESPLMEELACIMASPHCHFILIDNYALMRHPWPTPEEITGVVLDHGYHVVQDGDALVVQP